MLWVRGTFSRFRFFRWVNLNDKRIKKEKSQLSRTSSIFLMPAEISNFYPAHLYMIFKVIGDGSHAEIVYSKPTHMHKFSASFPLGGPFLTPTKMRTRKTAKNKWPCKKSDAQWPPEGSSNCLAIWSDRS